MLVHLVAESLLEEPVELAIVAKHDVAALIPGEPGLVDARSGRTAGVVGSLVDCPVVVTHPRKLSSACEAAGTCTHDRDMRSPGR